jgi:hypothetical protein
MLKKYPKLATKVRELRLSYKPMADAGNLVFSDKRGTAFFNSLTGVAFVLVSKGGDANQEDNKNL